MAAAADKARFFLEQSVPELKEYEKKKIFSKVYPREPDSVGCVTWERKTHISSVSVNRKKSLQLSRNDPISNTSSILEVLNRSILCDMRSMK